MEKFPHHEESEQEIGSTLNPTEQPQEVLLGVGKLSEVIGTEAAHAWFNERNTRHKILYARALQQTESGEHLRRLRRHKIRH